MFPFRNKLAIRARFEAVFLPVGVGGQRDKDRLHDEDRLHAKGDAAVGMVLPIPTPSAEPPRRRDEGTASRHEQRNLHRSGESDDISPRFLPRSARG
jgi:hypothetical protein